MLPELAWRVGSSHVTLSCYATALATGVAAGLVVAVRTARRRDAVLVLAPIGVAAGTAGAAAWHAAIHATPGLSSMGGIVAGVAAIAVGCRLLRVAFVDVLDAIVPGAIAGFGIGRVGCFLAGCCYGSPTTLAWGVRFPALGAPARHPAQLYEAVLDALVAWWCVRARGPGRATGRGLIGYGAVRLALEVVRDADATDRIAAWGPSVAQLCATVLIVIGLAIAHRSDPFWPSCAINERTSADMRDRPASPLRR
jgi:phosphatidylglycerol:prolipoprotein diacylglycerol transferase